jgi:hypothetical protein
MLASVGCDQAFMLSQTSEDNDSNLSDDEESNSVEEVHNFSVRSTAIARSMEKDWSSLIQSFPRGNYLSEGAFKKVFRVWNECLGAHEALSVM